MTLQNCSNEVWNALWNAAKDNAEIRAEIGRLKEKLQKWELLAISNIQGVMDTGWENTQLLMKNELLSSNVELVEKELKVLRGDIRVLLEKLSLAEWVRDINCESAQIYLKDLSKVRKELKDVKAQADKNWRLVDREAGVAREKLRCALIDIGTLEYDKKRLQNDVEALRQKLSIDMYHDYRDVCDALEAQMDQSHALTLELERKDSVYSQLLDEQNTLILDLRARLNDCRYWST